nr:hypothetical protein [Tanacetum cinerariifolium]
MVTMRSTADGHGGLADGGWNGAGKVKQCIKKGPYILTLLVTLEVPAEGDNPGQALDTCLTAREMWLAIERLQQRESINIQDMKTKLFWEFGKFTSRDGELVESYYTRNKGKEIINQLHLHLSQHLKKKVMENRLRGINRYREVWYSLQNTIKNNYKPTNNNLNTSSNTKNKKVDTSLRTGNDRKTRQFRIQRTDVSLCVDLLPYNTYANEKSEKVRHLRGSEGDIYDDPSLLRFYQDDDIPPWGNNLRKEEGEEGPEWVVRSKFKDEVSGFMLKKSFHTKGLGEMLDQHRKGMHEQFFEILTAIGKSKTPTPKPDAPAFAITTRSRTSTRDPPYPTPPSPKTINHTEWGIKKGRPKDEEPTVAPNEEAPCHPPFTIPPNHPVYHFLPV